MEHYTESEESNYVVPEAMAHLQQDEVKLALKVQGTLKYSLVGSLRQRGFTEIPPVIISPLTDPLNHPVHDPSMECYGGRMWLTKSMIFHKQLAVQAMKKIFIVSPNIRLETSDKALSGRHLYEFTQVDVEALRWSREKSMDLAEELIIEAMGTVREELGKELKAAGREVPVILKRFKRITYRDAEREYGDDFERLISLESTQPVWIIDIPLNAREFYDRESDHHPGILRDMDLIWPEGYQEALSGGEREYELKRILARISKKRQDPESFRWFLDAAKTGLQPSSGFGIGVERFTRYVCGLDHISKTTAFPKVPGKVSL